MDCPKCKFDIDLDDSPFYVILFNKIHILKDGGWKVDEKGVGTQRRIRMFLWKLVGKQVYPIITNQHEYYDSWSGQTGSGWNETHKCPKCKHIFTFYNGTL